MDKIEVKVYEGHISVRDYSVFYSALIEVHQKILNFLRRTEDYKDHFYDIRGDNGGDCMEIDGCDLFNRDLVEKLKENLETSSNKIEICCRRKS